MPRPAENQQTEPHDPFELRPVQRDTGEWDALDARGYGHSLGLKCRGSVEIWLSGYHAGAEENM